MVIYCLTCQDPVAAKVLEGTPEGSPVMYGARCGTCKALFRIEVHIVEPSPLTEEQLKERKNQTT